MITKSDLFEFFQNECDASQESIDKLYALDISERVKKRKAVEHVHIDPVFEDSRDGMALRKATAPVNISDFKIGEYLVLHDLNPNFPVSRCQLIEWGDDNEMLLGFGYGSNVGNVDNIARQKPGHDFMLDKDSVNLMNIYREGMLEIEDDDLKLINEVPKPAFSGDREDVEEAVDEICTIFNRKLTARQREAVVNAVLADDYYMIQGPPGTGKSFVIVVILVLLLFFRKERVLVSGPNHLAINNVLSKKLAPNDGHQGLVLKIGQGFNTTGLDYKDKDGNERYVMNAEYANVEAINSYNCEENGIAVGCTPFHMHTKRGRGLDFDTLIIDEAGQMNIGLALMAMSCAKKVIFVGDHKQMAPIFSAEDIKDELRKSIFEHLYRDYNCTTLDTTFRMNAPICDTVSSVFYDSVLKSAVGSQRMQLQRSPQEEELKPEHPVVIKNIIHEGTSSSEEEADYIVDCIRKYILEYGCNPENIAVIAPFRAQCALIRRRLGKLKEEIPEYKKIAVDTVDRMQGQESEIIFISITSGDLEYMSELSHFVFNPNRFNVAISRAKNKLFLVGNIDNIRLAAPGFDSEWLLRILDSDKIYNAR